MIQVAPSLYVGDQSDCDQMSYSVVHACKFPCFWKAVGGIQPKSTDPNYLHTFAGQNLYLNLIDSDQKKYFQPRSFEVAMEFIDGRISAKDRVLVHCNQGLSRAPAIAWLWLARRGDLSREFAASFAEFLVRYPDFAPSRGIGMFLHDHWAELVPQSVAA